MAHVYETIIVGAGAAGIACAKKLDQLGVDWLLIEARPQIGGRVYSLSEPKQIIPIELGAEFIHGLPPSVLQIFKDMQLPFYDVKDEHLLLKGKKLIFTAFVEGFYGADVKIIGEQGLADAKETDESSLNGSQLFRSLKPYDAFLHKILEQIAQPQRLQMQTELKEIRWEKGRVQLLCRRNPDQNEQTYECKKLVLTLPLGVLKSSQILWRPEPIKFKESLDGLEVGHVQRLVFRFRSRFWEKTSHCPTAFFHTGPEFYFPTWWSQQPLRTPYLVAWQGGPRAITMASWSEDPFSRGAYSYIRVGGLKQAQQLNRNLQNTIYFAGEATVMGPHRGTVHGAFD